MKVFSTAPVYSARENQVKIPHITHTLQCEVEGLSFSPHPATLIETGVCKHFPLNSARLSLAVRGLVCAKNILAHSCTADARILWQSELEFLQ